MSTTASPPFVEYLDDYLHRRTRSGMPLTPGESVTLAVGLLRGCRRVEDRAHAANWALTARGCPVLVDDVEGEDAVGVTASALAQLAEMIDDEDRALIEGARDAVLTQPPLAWEEAERRLFAWAAPVPLVLGPLAPRVDDGGTPPPAIRRQPIFLSAVDADLATLVTAAMNDLREKWGIWRYRRAFAFAVVAAGVAVVLGLVLPTGATSPAPPTGSTASPSSSSGDPTPDATRPTSPHPSVRPTVLDPGRPTPLLTVETPAPSPAESSSAEEDIVDAAKELLTAYSACAGDIVCEQSLREGRADPGEAIPTDPAGARISLVDDFGGLSVVRVDGGGEPQYITLVRENDRWLVRAVRTGANQPS
ncbi:hypothetical protein NS220_09410 [Microbacterium testaceum]|uniref:Uncharacterized protein n=1 Tax=Microbacterium testaceum TaxID=2033 RepID=A0A147EX03_MICTE|nr:hypothetical protein [Microbacterium testaceum]KTR94352.1 hypothetical protein NS220_09410 [Microbacterium testaceum]